MSTWYSDGTIDVAEGGDVATGTGTAFLANVRVGDGIAIAGSATLHEVTNIASNQQLTFQPPFAGQAGSALAYRIAPVQGYVKRAADRLAQIVAEYGDTLAALGDEETRQLVIELAENITPAGLELMGKATAAEQRQVLILDRVDNTPDAEKPVSAPQLQALDAKADAEDVATALTGKADAEQTAQALAGKVDKEAGKGLSHNDLTDELYDKLASIEGSRWQGVYTSLEALATAKPIGEPGWFAWVDAGENQPVKMAIWDIDDQQWRISSGEGGTMTPAQVLEALKANPDVNVLTDAQLAKLVETLVFSQADKDKLDSVDTGAQKNPDAVSQAEVQAGTSTALRSWSVLRVWQAIQAWWNASAMKTKLDSFPSMPPADGKTYALKDGQWVESAGGGGGNLFDVQFYTGLRANLAAERPGFAFLDGQKALRSVWPGAFARINNYPLATEAAWAAGDKGKFTLGDGSTDFRLADWNGATGGKARVLRGGVAGTEGTFEEDALQNITGTFQGSETGAKTTGAFKVEEASGSLAGGGSQRYVYSFDASRVVRAADETRAASVKGAWIVRLSNAAGPVGQVDVQALATQVSDLQAQLTTKLSVTEVGGTATNGYRKFSDGTIEQWGAVSVPNLPVATGNLFSWNTPFLERVESFIGVSAGVGRSTQAEANNNFQAVSLTQFRISSGMAATPLTFNWFARGR